MIWIALLLLLVPVPFASAQQIQLRQSDGTLTPLGGTGDHAHVTCDNCGGGGGGGTGTEYTEDAASAANPVGPMQMCRRRDTLTGSEVSADGDNIACNATSKGEIYVKQTDAVPVTDNGGSLTVDGTVSISGSVTVTDGAGALNTIVDSGTITTITNPVTITDGSGALNVIVDSSALPTGASTSANQTTIIGHVDGLEGLIGTTNTNTGTVAGAIKAEDAAHSSGDAGIMMMGVRKDTAAALAGTDGDYQPPIFDASGRLWINCGTGCSGGTQFAEDAAHTTGDVGTMALTVRKDTAAATARTDGDYQPPITDATGRMWTNTEMPDAATLADATSNPTVPGVASFNMCFNGTTWDRCVKAVDPCQVNTKSYANINGTAGATIITGTASKKIYVCSLVLVTATAQNINLVSGTGTVCGTGTTAMLGLSGGTTAATGWNLSANGGLTLGSGGFSLGQTQNNADNLCMLTCSTGQITGGLSYVVQ